METFKVGLIRVLTTEDQEVLLAHGKTIMEIFPGIEVETKCIPDQYEGIHSEELCRIAIPKIVETAKTFQDADMLILDEAVGACSLGFIKEERLLELIGCKPEKLEVILTGRNPSKELLAAADYVTEMVMRAHPYTRGIPARKGIEY